MKRALLALLLAGAAACGPAPAAERTSIDLGEFYVEAEASRWAAGDVGLTIANSGEFGHTLVITDEDEAVVASVGVIAPGEEVDVSIDVEPGTYQLTCRIVIEAGEEGQIVDHFEEGMVAEVTVSPSPSRTANGGSRRSPRSLRSG